MPLPPAAAGSIGTGELPQPGPSHYITAVRGPVNRRVGLFRRWQPGVQCPVPRRRALGVFAVVPQVCRRKQRNGLVVKGEPLLRYALRKLNASRTLFATTECSAAISGNADGRRRLGNRAERARKAFLEFDGRFPTEYLASSCDVRLADLRIVDRERLENDLTIGAG